MEEKKPFLSGYFEKISVMLKLGFILGLMLLLLIPQFMVTSLIGERENTRNQAVAEVSGKWGNSQTLAGPVLTVPYEVFDRSTDSKGNITVHRSVKYLHFLPEELDLKAKADPEIRYRGIFHVVLYRLGLSTRGRFHIPPMASLGVPPQNVLWDQVFLAVGVSDLRGVQEEIPFSWNNHRFVFQPGINGLSALSTGIYSPVPLSAGQRNIDYSFDLKLNGSKRLSFVPSGKTTTVHLESAWSSPSFDGSYLPQNRQIGEKGFTADWKIFYLSRSIPQIWQGSQVGWEDLERTSFGASFLYPVDAYQKVTRSAKYGALYILLTFGVFFLFEILAGLRIHSIQYLLVGFAIILFYLLLLSLSEYLAFALAYALACLGIVGLITGYSRSVLCDWKKAGAIGLLMAVLYGNLFVLLQLEDYALLLGSLGLFIALATAMYVTRKVDWYEVGRKQMPKR
jgi:inner membrane protein